MPFILLILVAILMFAFPVVRCAVFNPVKVVKNGVVDLYLYFKLKKYNKCKTGELTAYVGLFGKGKTLSAVHKVVKLYERYNDKPVWCGQREKFVTQKIKVISNVTLKIPYEELASLKQIVYSAQNNSAIDDANDTVTRTIVLGDEFSVQLNSRNFKDNIDALFLNTLLTCRHYHISIFYTTQRFMHVDALFRQVTSKVVSCNKIWRFQCLNSYDAWEMENATNPQVLTPLRRECWFVTNKDYAAYDTYATVGQLERSVAKGDMLTETEILALQNNNPVGMDAVAKPSRRWRVGRKSSKK